MDITHIIGLTGLSAILLFSGCKPLSKQNEPSSSSPKGAATQKPFALEIQPLSGGSPLNLGQKADKEQLLVFFAPWADSGPAVLQWISDLTTTEIDVLPVVVDRREGEFRLQADSMKEFNRPVFLADEALLTSLGGIRALPTAVWISKGSTIAGTWAGLPSFTGIVASVTGSSHRL